MLVPRIVSSQKPLLRSPPCSPGEDDDAHGDEEEEHGHGVGAGGHGAAEDLDGGAADAEEAEHADQAQHPKHLGGREKGISENENMTWGHR